MSVTQATSGASTANLRSRAFSATGKLCLESVVALKGRFLRPLSPNSDMIRATRLRLTSMPFSCSSKWMRGLPTTPSECTWFDSRARASHDHDAGASPQRDEARRRAFSARPPRGKPQGDRGGPRRGGWAIRAPDRVDRSRPPLGGACGGGRGGEVERTRTSRAGYRGRYGTSSESWPFPTGVVRLRGG